jgi:hypothetical protein
MGEGNGRSPHAGRSGAPKERRVRVTAFPAAHGMVWAGHPAAIGDPRRAIVFGRRAYRCSLQPLDADAGAWRHRHGARPGTARGLCADSGGPHRPRFRNEAPLRIWWTEGRSALLRPGSDHRVIVSDGGACGGTTGRSSSACRLPGRRHVGGNLPCLGAPTYCSPRQCSVCERVLSQTTVPPEHAASFGGVRIGGWAMTAPTATKIRPRSGSCPTAVVRVPCKASLPLCARFGGRHLGRARRSQSRDSTNRFVPPRLPASAGMILSVPEPLGSGHASLRGKARPTVPHENRQ